MMSSIYERALECAKPKIENAEIANVTARKLIEECVNQIKDKELTSDDLTNLIINFAELVKEK
jgi:hypothetical protein